VLGRLVADVSLAGDLQLDRELAIKAVAKIADQIGLSVEETALGIVSVANEHMARAIREISVNRGHDPADFMLASFGGAGGLHVCALAEAMHMRQAIVPNRGGVLSAMGMLVAPRGRQFARTVNRDSEAADSASLENEFRELAELGKLELLAEGLAAENLSYQRSADLRYKGQSYTLNVPWEDTQQAIDAFQTKHRQRYGYDMAVAVEIINLRVTVTAEDVHFQLPVQRESGICNKPRYTEVYGQAQPAQLFARDDLTRDSSVVGPAIIHEYAATSYVAQGWHGRVDSLGNLILSWNG
jgi:N-methylhydantoinase A